MGRGAARLLRGVEFAGWLGAHQAKKEGKTIALEPNLAHPFFFWQGGGVRGEDGGRGGSGDKIFTDKHFQLI